MSCDNGTRMRTRSCSDPAPAKNGKVCIGNDTDTEVCHLGVCRGNFDIRMSVLTVTCSWKNLFKDWNHYFEVHRIDEKTLA